MHLSYRLLVRLAISYNTLRFGHMMTDILENNVLTEAIRDSCCRNVVERGDWYDIFSSSRI